MRFLTADGLGYLQSLNGNVLGTLDKPDVLAGSILAERLSPCSLLDALFIDVDYKDTASGVTAPPPAFVSEDALHTMHLLLANEGALVLNVAARVEAYLTEILNRLAKLFVQVYKIQASEENLNIVVVGVKHSQVLDATQREALLSKWLKVLSAFVI